MKTSERLEAISGSLSGPRAEVRRLSIDLPDGATLEAVEAAEHHIQQARALLNYEAAMLRKWND